MNTINIHAAKTQLSKLVDQAAKGQPFIIAKAGKPMVKVVPIEPAPRKSRVGFMEDILVPADFDTMGQEHIISLFEGDL